MKEEQIRAIIKAATPLFIEVAVVVACIIFSKKP
jgi:hypothetical protein